MDRIQMHSSFRSHFGFGIHDFRHVANIQIYRIFYHRIVERSHLQIKTFAMERSLIY